MGNIFFSFDGCAQYLSSPTAPYLIAHAYHQSHTPPPVLVACIRNPVDQGISWWQYENNAMLWGESMGLKEWNTKLRSEKYPPKTILDALEYSQSPIVQQAYSDAEHLVKAKLQIKCPGKINQYCLISLPPWAVTWPGGQLSIFGRGYLSCINRYNHVFSSTFGAELFTRVCPENNSDKIGFVHIAPIQSQETGRQLKLVLRPILADVLHRCAIRTCHPFYALMYYMDFALEKVCANVIASNRRNSSPQTQDHTAMVSVDERKVFRDHFQREVTEMEIMLGRSMNYWK